ncbi:MAG TPA: TonB-dependent receptor, partial [Terriglobales bacterium]|nr:TonB-dependent receptor [Terriglobales bacterium]
MHQSQTGISRVAQIDNVGQYQVSNLEPGDYEIEVAAPSFDTQVQRVALRVGDSLTVNFRLKPGSVGERVVVNGQTSDLNTTDFTVSSSVSRIQIQNLPLNGRNFLEFARLEPGVSVISVVNPGTFANNYQHVSIAGAQYLLTQVTVDGVAVQDRINGGTAQNFSQETVQEFQVERFSFDPSSAMSGAGAINIVTRRGNNELHGAAFFYYRDHNMAAYPGLHRDVNHPDPYFARKQSGFRLGGPLKKDRVFWFTNFEHNRQTAAVAIQNNHPVFSKLDVVYPSPLTFSQFNLRVDGKLNETNTAFLRLSQDKNNTIAPPAAGLFMPSDWQSSRNSALQIEGGDVSVLSSRMVNDMRYAFSYLHSHVEPVSSQQCLDPAACIGVGGAQIQVFDAPQFQIGNRPAAPFGIVPRTNQFVDTVTWLRGAHQLHLGGDWEHVY